MSEEHVYIEPVNETHVRLLTNPGIIQELSDALTFEVPNARFMPSVKNKIWDGKIRLLNRSNNTVYKGLVPYILRLCNERSYRITADPEMIQPFKEHIDFSFDDLTLKNGIEPRDYQKRALDVCLKKKRCITISPTASGKSLIIYGLCRALQSLNKNILLIVPTVSLVDQMYGDFDDYATDDTVWYADDHCHRVYGGVEEKKVEGKTITITTWQSVYKKNRAFFDDYDAVIGDEVHTYDAKGCTGILEKCTNALYRFGFTGTLKDSKTHELSLTGLFGPVTEMTTTKELMDRGMIAKLRMNCIVLRYSEALSKPVRGATYHDEIDHMVGIQQRNDFIKNLAATRKGNTLILFNLVEKHGKPMYDHIQSCLGKSHHVFLVYGGTEKDQREKVRKLVEQHDNVIILASYGLFSTGVNMVNLSTVILAAPSKSRVRVLQSIGRGLRKSKSKTKVDIIDIADDFRGDKKSENFAIKHFRERYEMYSQGKFDTDLLTYDIK